MGGGIGAVIRRGWLVVLALGLSVAGLARLHFDADILGLLPGDLPEVRGLALQQRHFAGGRQLWLTLSGPDADTTADAARDLATTLRDHPGLVRSAQWQAPWREHSSDLPELLGWLWLNQPPSEFEALVARLTPERLPATLAGARETLATSLSPLELAQVAHDPFGFTQLPGGGLPQGAGADNGFASDDGTFRVVAVEPVESPRDFRAAIRWLAQIRRTVATVPAVSAGTVRIKYTGGPAFSAEIARGMQQDFASSVITTVLVIGALFWIAHRSWRPLLRLLGMLILTLVLTLLAGGVLFGSLNVVSLGFAAVLLGLVVDYGLVTYQERVAEPHLSPAALRRELAPSLGWAAMTTGGTFLAVSGAGLPGLAQLGVLVAIGIVTGSGLMLWHFSRPLPPALAAAGPPPPADQSPPHGYRGAAAALTAVLLAGAALLLFRRGTPALETSAEPLRPRQSEAYSAMEELSRRMLRTDDPLWLVVSGPDANAVEQGLQKAQARLEQARLNGTIRSYNLPLSLWPRMAWARTNRETARPLVGQEQRLREAALAAGFTTNALDITDGVLRTWSVANAADAWLTNATARWLTSQAVAHDGNLWLALGIVQPAGAGEVGPLVAALARDQIWLTGWSRLGPALLERVSARVGRLTAMIALALLVCLGLSFRRPHEVFLSLLALAFSGLLILAAMRAADWSWNLMNLVAVPLLLGTSVDSTIHVMLALRRHGGSVRAMWRTTGRALVLCAGANLAGFGSLAFSSNAGLASLDLLCALGVLAVFSVSLVLLPAWWLIFAGKPPAVTRGPSNLYRVGWWRLALHLPAFLPRRLLAGLCEAGALAYAATHPDRRRIVAENLLPWTAGDSRQTRRYAWRNFAAFGRKLADLWRYEAGIDVLPLVRPGTGWEQFQKLRTSDRGVLWVTVHLGNWEFGAPLLERSGCPLLVLTAPEPTAALTELRRKARARHGIRTLVVGDDPFAFVEVMKCLNEGGSAALLLDRASGAHAVTVDWCGRPYQASPAAAELARATGCLIVPVVLPRVGDCYEARLLPPVVYERQALGDRAARAGLTAAILRVFEPAVREFPDQWFHFVPVWTNVTGAPRSS